MVATRRGALVCSPNKTTRADESLGVQATPSTGRRTRRGATQLDTATAASEEEPRSQTQESAEESVPCSQSRRMPRRCARSSRLHSPSQPSTPAGCVHEADVSDMESNCSALSDSEPPVVRSQRRGRKSPPPRTVSQEEEAASEAESCSAPLSEKRRTRRSTRARKTPERPYTSQSDAGEQEGSSQRATRSTRRSTRAKTPAKTASECAELSDADSWVSSASEAPASASSTSTAGRSTHLARRAALGQPIALCLDAPSEGSQSPAPAGGRRRGTRATSGPPAACSEQLSCDSEGLESGPGTPQAPRRSTRSGSRGGRSLGVPATDLDSDTLGAAQSDTRNAGRLSVVLERVPGHGEDPGENPLVPTVASEAEPAGDDNQLNESKLELTVVEDTDCTVLEDKTIHLDEEDDNNDDDDGGGVEDEGATNADLEPPESADVMISVGRQGGVALSVSADVEVEEEEEEETTGAPQPSDVAEAEEGTGKNEEIKSPAAGGEVTADDQQGEPSQERQCEDDVADDEPAPTQEEEPETMEPETVLPSTPPPPPPPPPPVHTEEPAVMEDMDADTETVSKDAVLQEGGGSEEMVTLEVEQAQAMPIQVSSSQEPKVKVAPVSEPTAVTATTTTQRSDVVVQQKTGTISLLDSSEEEEEEEDDDEDECDVLEEEEEADDNVERVIPSSSKLPDDAASGGLFVIDTRPGQQADEQYLKEGLEVQEEKEEEVDDDDFVDEEGDEDDDEDTQMLLYCRNPKSKEMSTRIDPGLRVKELGGLYINFNGGSKSKTKLKEQKIQDEVMKDSVMGPEFEKQSVAPKYIEAKRSLKQKRKEVKEKTTGDGWFNMKAPELTPELKADLKLLKMRGSMDPKRFYKKNDRDGLPKYFQIGTVMDSPVDFYHSRIPKKDRKRTMVEELVADANFRRQNKKKYQEIMAEKAAQAAGRHKKKRFHQKKPVA